MNSVGRTFEQSTAEMAWAGPRHPDHWPKRFKGLDWLRGWDFFTTMPCTWAGLTGQCHLTLLFVGSLCGLSLTASGSSDFLPAGSGLQAQCSNEQGRSCIRFYYPASDDTQHHVTRLCWSMCHRPPKLKGSTTWWGVVLSHNVRKYGMRVLIVAFFGK